MRGLVAFAGKTALAAGLALGLPSLILVFVIALASGVSWGGAFGRGVIALAVLGGIGWIGGAVVQLAQEPRAANGATTVGSQIDLTVGGPAGAGQEFEATGATHQAALGDRSGQSGWPAPDSR